MKLSTLFLLCTGATGVVFGDVPDCLVEYIESTNTASYVDTGIAPNPRKTRMVVKLAPMVVDNNQVAFFGSGNSWGNNVCNFVLLNSGMFRLDWIGAQTKVFTPNVGQAYLFDCRNNVVSIDGQQWSNGNATMKTDADYPERPILLFNAMNDKGKVGGAMMRLYECRIYQDGEKLDCNYLPCVKDGLAGLYNTVNGTIVYDFGGKNFAASGVERTVDYRISGDSVQTTLKLTKPSVGGTCAEPEERWATMNGKVTLTATPDKGMKAAWTVSDIDGKLTSYYGDTVEITMPPCPSTVSLSFYAADALTTVTQLREALGAAQGGETIRLAPGEYELDSEIVIDKAITLEGAGRQLTILKPIAAGGEFRAINMTEAATVRNLKITGFKANVEGLGVYMTKGTLDNVWIYGNTMYCTSGSLMWGAGVYVNGTDCVVTNCTVEKCFADRNYGSIRGIGIQLKGGTVVDSEILDNERERSEFYGGGVYICAKDSYLIRCLIKGNGSRGKGVNTNNTLGMGVYMDSEGVIDSCRIIGNDIQGVWLSKGVMKNCLVTGHKSTAVNYTAGVQMSGTAKMYNCTIWGNEAANAFAGLQMTGGTAVNNIIWNNGMIANASASGGTFNTNVVDAASAVATATAVGNINSDPWMTDPENGDFTLTFESPALDAAAPLEEVATDLRGVARPQGVAPDIGAFESSAAGGDLQGAIIVPTVDWKFGDDASVMCRAAGGSGNYTYTWYVDGVEHPEQTDRPTFVGLSLGKHTLRLVISDGETSIEKIAENALDMHPTTVYVSESGGDEYPYDTEAKAARSVNDAFTALWKAAGDVSTIHVGEGDYDVTATLTLNTPCRLLGAGRDRTRLHGGKLGTFRAFEIAHADAVAKDFTIDGCTNKQKGVAIALSAGWLENVRSTRNRQDYESGSIALPGGAGLSISGGTATNCLIDANFGNANWGYSTGIGVRLEGGLIVDCDIRDNWMARNQPQGIGAYVTGGTLLASRIVNNYSTLNAGDSHGDGLCVEGGTVDRCLIATNGWAGVYLTNGAVKNSLITGHHGTGSIYSGVSMPSGTGKLYNCTIVGNVSDAATDGRSGLQMAAGTAVNNIIYGNGSVGSCAITGGTFNTNIIGNAVAIGVGNIEVDPKFKDAAAGDFSIKSGSTAVDAGAALPEVDVDFDGVARPQKNGWDIGCYEYVPGSTRTLSISAPQTKAPVGGAIVAGVSQEGLEVAEATFTWTLTRAGETVEVKEIFGEDGLSYAYTAKVFGDYTLTLSATDGLGTLEADSAETFTVSPTEVYVSNEGRGEFPYDEPAKATSDFCAAVAALWQDVGSTTVVHVAAGEYAMTGPVALGMPVRVLGAGRDSTVLNAAALPNTQRAFTLTHADAVLSDLGVTGATNMLAGSGINMTAGTLCDVRIFGNCTKMSDGDSRAVPGGVGLWMSGGLATNCVIEANVAMASYGQTSGVGLRLSGGLAVDCVIRDNEINRYEVNGVGVFISGGTLRRCRIEGNSTCGHAEDNVVGVGLGTVVDDNWTQGTLLNVEDCAIVGNGVQGLYGAARRGRFVNVLVADHETTTTHFPAGAHLTCGEFVNCTFAGNKSPEGATGDLKMSEGTLVNSIAVSADVADKVEKRNNCLNEPVAFKPDYRLRGSAANCIDKGDNSVWDGVAEPTDLRGNPRIDRINKTVDLGCFEWLPVGFKLFVR